MKLRVKNLLDPAKVGEIQETSLEGKYDGAEVELDQGTRSIGHVTAAFLILNRIVGTGIFATPSTIFVLAGSAGFTMILWLIGTLIALSGLLVYMEFGVALPRNGGEKNYLEFIYRRPRFLITCMYGMYVFFLGWASGNSIVFGEFILHAAGVEPTRWNQRGVGIACVTFAFLIHAVARKAGMLLQNVLGIFKLVVIAMMSVIGWVALGGGLNIPKTDNFSHSFAGTTSSGYGVVTALYSIIWSYVGYSNANYALGEVRNPVKTLRIAAPTALIGVAVLYMFVNVAYFAVVPADEFRSSGTILAAVFFRIVFGESGEKALSVIVALSALGNVMSVVFSQGRVVQQLGREGVLPFSRFFAASWPGKAPGAGLFQHWVICVITIVAPPPGDAYNFILNLISYPLNIVNGLISSGLIYLYIQQWRGKVDWNPPFRATFPVAVLFTLANAFLIVAPYLKPDEGQNVYHHLPYYIHCVVGLGILLFGGVYWVFWAHLIPKLMHYELVVEPVIGEDGFYRNNIVKRKVENLRGEGGELGDVVNDGGSFEKDSVK